MARVQEPKSLTINEDLIMSCGTLKLQDSADKNTKTATPTL